jgi:two-component system, chemotaxis family, chemotaxis protein CheY
MMMNVLVVDDSKAMRTILRKILETVDVTVEEAGTCREGLSKLASGLHFDVVLVDWNMPGMSGLDFVRAVRANPLHHNLRLMMVTAETEQCQMEMALAEGANEYVMKPFTKEGIQEKLRILGLREKMQNVP